MKPIEIVFDRQNRDGWFVPLDRSIRGKFLLSRVAEPTAMMFRDRIPDEIGGQVLGLDLDKGEGYLREPIYRLPAVKKMLEAREFRFEDELQTFKNVDVNAWLFWMKAAVDSGAAKVIDGQLPATVNYTPPPRLGRRPKTGKDRLAEIFRQHPDTAAQYLAWPAEKQKAWEQLVGV